MRLRILRRLPRRLPHLVVGIGVTMLLFALSAPLFTGARASADLLSLRSVEVSSPTASDTGVKYRFGFTNQTDGPLGSIVIQVCSNYLYQQTDVCIPPAGFDATGASLTDQQGVTGFTLNPASSGSKFILSRPSTFVAPQPLSYEISGLTNPSNEGSYYVHFGLFSSTDGSGTELDYGNAVFAINNDITITTEVPPYLSFCVGITINGYNCGTATGGEIDFGELSTSSTRTGTSQMLASTNAPYGYSVTLAGTTMTAGSNVIPAMTGSQSRIGVSQFGINSRANSVPAVGSDPDGPGLVQPTSLYDTPNQFRFVSGDIISASSAPDDYRKLTVSYIVNRQAGQPPGLYVATVSYICLANF